MPLQPGEFAEFIGAEVGTESAMRLVNYVFGLMRETGNPDPWIREVARARERGTFSPAVAHFLIYALAEWATLPLSDTHPVLSRLEAEMERIEREHGLEENEYWLVNEAPPEWQALNADWDVAMDALLMDIFVRNDERTVAETHAAGDNPLFDEGRALIFGNELRSR